MHKKLSNCECPIVNFSEILYKRFFFCNSIDDMSKNPTYQAYHLAGRD